MRFVVLALALLLGLPRADAQSPPPPVAVSAPIRVALECEEAGRTKVCPAFLLGFIDANKVLLPSPRAGADVVIYVTATQVAMIDRVQLRFVGRMEGAPAAIELGVDIDSRGTDDEQRAQLEPAFLRGMAVYVGARYPKAVTVALQTPAEVAAASASVGSPFGLVVEIGGNGSYTERYRSAFVNLNIVGKYVTRERRALVGMFSNAGLNRQPPLEVDGQLVSLDTERWFIRAGAEFIQLLDEKWSIGAGSFTNFEDPKAQYKYSNRSRAAIEWDRFASDDPRGNRLAVFYHLGWVTERYRVRNELGETFSSHPVHGINAVGSLRHDKLEFGLELETEVQLLHPTRRRVVTLSPEIAIKLGDHVDLRFSLSLTQRETPAPDMDAIDPSDFAQLSRLSYAEPLSISGSLSISLHWDPTNGVRNDRIDSI
ncbi:MAG: hypothetical protein ACKV2T_29465 [Kofleriaceae bacterium]